MKVLSLNFLSSFSAQNNWLKWMRKKIVWCTIGKSTGHGSSPTGTIVVTEVSRFALTNLNLSINSIHCRLIQRPAQWLASPHQQNILVARDLGGWSGSVFYRTLTCNTEEKLIENLTRLCRWATTGQPWQCDHTLLLSCLAQSFVSLALRTRESNCLKQSSHGYQFRPLEGKDSISWVTAPLL